MHERFIPKVRRLANGRYLVQSETAARHGQTIGHQVDLAAGVCGCAGYRWRGRCTHLDLARSVDAAMRAWKAQARIAGSTPARPAGMAALQECFG